MRRKTRAEPPFAAFPCSKDAAFITGQVLAVGRGWRRTKTVPSAQ